MAATVTWEVLRDLAAFRAEKGCAISLYLDLDPSESPTAEAVDTRSNALLDAVSRWESANLSELVAIEPVSEAGFVFGDFDLDQPPCGRCLRLCRPEFH